MITVCCGESSSGIPPRMGGSRFAARCGPASPPVQARGRPGRRAGPGGRRPGDLVVVSLHWGSNWGYQVGPGLRSRFARGLIDGGVDLVHGHSSHHPRPIEVYRGKLILYGCGDFIDDYEGITGYEEYRADLRLLYLASLRRGTGELAGLRMVPMQARKLRLQPACDQDRRWLAATLDRVSRRSGRAWSWPPTACSCCTRGRAGVR